MTPRIERKDRKIIRGMKQDEDHHSIILTAMRVQCNACMIGLMSMAHEPWTIFGRTTQPKVLTQDNAWRVRRNWSYTEGAQDTFYVYNYLTEERRPITQEQYDNANTITQDGRLAI